jgi:signal peptide peptidase SppA
MTGKYEHVLGFALEHPWALTESMRAIVADIIAHRVAGQDVEPAAIAAAMVQRKNLPQPRKGGAVAVIPFYGVVAPRMNMLSEFSGGTTFEQLTAQLHEAVANKEIATIVFDVDSPGGNVAGASEFAREVLKARTVKPVIACAQFLMASAAYWPMACATEVVAAPSAMVGAIGVYTIHDDVSAALEKLGIKREVIGAGKFKTEGVGGGPLSDEARAHIKALCETVYARQLGDIAKGRGITAAAVRNGYAEGRCVDVEAALAAGMIDRIGTLADTLARVMTAPPADATTRPAATTQEPPLAAVTVKEQQVADVLWQNAALGALLELEF